jgi:hypothetical protein
MSDDPRRLTTDEQRERAQIARRRGGLCAWCGRTLAEDEAVYVERVKVNWKPYTGASTRRSRGTVHWDLPVGAECASPGFLRRVAAREPERCAACGRPMHYAVIRATRRRATCSGLCSVRGAFAGQKAAPEVDR